MGCHATWPVRAPRFAPWELRACDHAPGRVPRCAIPAPDPTPFHCYDYLSTSPPASTSSAISHCYGLRQWCPLHLLLIRVTENRTQDTWRNLRLGLQRLHLVTLATDHGKVAQRSLLTPGQQAILHQLELPEPPRFYDFRPEAA